MNVLVTGKDGQLGKCMQDSCKNDKKNNYFFFNHKELDITDASNVEKIFSQIKPDFVVNCAAYTNTRLAETNYEDSYNVNTLGVEILANNCSKYNSYFIHISTETVFDGRKKSPYKETDATNPLCVYAETKLKGETNALKYGKSIVIRVPWLYSEYGKNFYRIMSERIHFKIKTNVVTDQIGTPTYAMDVSDFIVNVLINDNELEKKCGLYHFSNNGQASRYDFASAIEALQKKKCDIKELKNKEVYILQTTTEKYKDVLKHPKYGVLCKDKLEQNFNYVPDHWISALIRCMKVDDEL